MWCLEGREGICVYIVPGQKKSFGKSLSDIKLEGDPTISRLHAAVSVEAAEESDALCKCVISDLSKYGTFVVRDGQSRKLLADEKFVLKAGDTVQFGLKQTTFTVSCYSFVIARSSLGEKDTARLTSATCLLGARLSEAWENSCTHLTVSNSILFTTKLACALASAKPIVTIAYWEAIHLAVRESTRLPDIENFLPTVKEEWLRACSRLLLPNGKRKALFKGLSFVHFCAKQYFAYSPLITAAGGKSCVYPTKRPLVPRDLTAKNAVVVQQPANDSSQFASVIATDYPIIHHKLRAIKRRMVSDTEIPLAILHCSTEMYCNPRFEFVAFLQSSKIQTELSSSDVVITEDTQNINKTDKGRIEGNIIAETCVSQNNENVSRNVRLFDESARRDIFEANGNSVLAMKTMRHADQRKVMRKIIPETCESQRSDDVSENVHPCNKDKQKSIADTSETDVVANIFSKRVQKQHQVIPEGSCCLEKNASATSVFSEQARAVSEISELNETDVVKDLAARKVLRNVESQRKRGIFLAEKGHDALVPVAINDQQRENYLIAEKNNSHCTENNVFLGKDDSLNEDKSDDATWQSSKKFESLKRPRIVSIEKIDSSGINIERTKGKMSVEDRTKVQESSSPLKERKLDPSCSAYRQDEGTKENRTRMRDKEAEKPRKRKANWYDRYLNPEHTDEILRKDAPRGKKFTKMPIVVPKRILRMDDFVMTTT